MSLDKFNQLYNVIKENIITEKHTAFLKFFPISNKDGSETNWFMGPSDFSGKGKNKMKCSLNPQYEIKKDETVLINPDTPGIQVAYSQFKDYIDGNNLQLQETFEQLQLPKEADIK